MNASTGAADGRAARRNTQLVLLDQAMVSGANFLAGLLLGRLLGPQGYGEFTLTYNAILLLSGVQMALLAAPMQVFGAQRPGNEVMPYYGAVRLMQAWSCVALGVLGLLVVWLLSAWFPQWGLAGLALPVAIAVVGFLAQDFARRYWFARDRPAAALSSDVATHALRILIFVLLGLRIGLHTRTAFWVIGLSSMAGLLVAWIWLRREPSHYPPPTLRTVAGEHWRAGKWLLADNLVYWFGGQMLVIYIAGNVLSAAAVGKITAAMNIVGVANILFLALENFAPSRAASRHAEGGAQALTRYLRRVAYLGGGITLSLVLVATVWSEFWLKLLYGAAYAGNGKLVAWWGLYYVIGFLQRPFTFGLRVLGDTRAIFFATCTGAALCVLLSYPLVKHLGMDGTMLALCLVQLTVLLSTATLFMLRLRRHRSSSVAD